MVRWVRKEGVEGYGVWVEGGWWGQAGRKEQMYSQMPS